jgi:hypothetical protein
MLRPLAAGAAAAVYTSASSFSSPNHSSALTVLKTKLLGGTFRKNQKTHPSLPKRDSLESAIFAHPSM